MQPTVAISCLLNVLTYLSTIAPQVCALVLRVKAGALLQDLVFKSLIAAMLLMDAVVVLLSNLEPIGAALPTHATTFLLIVHTIITATLANALVILVSVGVPLKKLVFEFLFAARQMITVETV